MQHISKEMSDVEPFHRRPENKHKNWLLTGHHSCERMTSRQTDNLYGQEKNQELLDVVTDDQIYAVADRQQTGRLAG